MKKGQRYWMLTQVKFMIYMGLAMHILLKKHLNTEFKREDIELAGHCLTIHRELNESLYEIKEALEARAEPEAAQ